jgi:hypothetical protein
MNDKMPNPFDASHGEPLNEKGFLIKQPNFSGEPHTINLLTYPKPKWSIEFAPDCFIYTLKKI